jgi:protease PrsW
MHTILLICSVLAATVPMAGCLGLIWWLDRYNREPVPLVAAVFAWGAIFAIIGSFAISSFGSVAMAQFFGVENADLLGTMFLAPIVEEPMKASILLVVAATRWFDNTTDGFVYGAATGLGFAMTENLMYFYAHIEGGAEQWLYVVLVRTVCTGMMHALASAVVGASLGWAKCRTTDLKVTAFLMGLVTAMAIHGVWNTLIVLDVYIGGQALAIDLLLFLIEFVLIFGTFMLCIEGEHRMMVRELMEEAKGGVLPPQHVHILASVRRRSRVGWCPPSVDPQAYIDTATSLAFRRMQCRGRGPKQAVYYREAREIRHRLRSLLGTRPLPPDDAGN